MFEIILINGRSVLVPADEIKFEDGTYYLYEDYEVVAEFQRNNIAGFCRLEVEDGEG